MSTVVSTTGDGALQRATSSTATKTRGSLCLNGRAGKPIASAAVVSPGQSAEKPPEAVPPTALAQAKLPTAPAQAKLRTPAAKRRKPAARPQQKSEEVGLQHQPSMLTPESLKRAAQLQKIKEHASKQQLRTALASGDARLVQSGGELHVNLTPTFRGHEQSRLQQPFDQVFRSGSFGAATLEFRAASGGPAQDQDHRQLASFYPGSLQPPPPPLQGMSARREQQRAATCYEQLHLQLNRFDLASPHEGVDVDDYGVQLQRGRLGFESHSPPLTTYNLHGGATPGDLLSQALSCMPLSSARPAAVAALATHEGATMMRRLLAGLSGGDETPRSQAPFGSAGLAALFADARPSAERALSSSAPLTMLPEWDPSLSPPQRSQILQLAHDLVLAATAAKPNTESRKGTIGLLISALQALPSARLCPAIDAAIVGSLDGSDTPELLRYDTAPPPGSGRLRTSQLPSEEDDYTLSIAPATKKPRCTRALSADAERGAAGLAKKADGGGRPPARQRKPAAPRQQPRFSLDGAKAARVALVSDGQPQDARH
ncbi:hypothetical protein T492DRAFT_843111 [Pavlovales sp. CCMP2436]|nr:hypothetical protein T492DRAFT_843111 [Pavlovales sp. CCMP2436]